LRSLLACLILLAAAQAFGVATLRGQLNRKLPNGTQTPAAGITVTVLSQAKVRSARAISQQNGMFYLNNLPAGSYSLEVWVKGTANPPIVYPIQVKEPYTDIPPIILP
jgi:hypothetical protein